MIENKEPSRLPVVLYVDDELKSLKYFEKFFEKEFQVITASSAQEGMDILDDRGQQLAVLLVDQRMPMRPGVDLLAMARDKFPNITRIMTTAYTDIDSAVRAINEGQVFRYVTKPWDLELLKEILLLAVEENKTHQHKDLSVDERVDLAKRLVVADRVENLRRSAECVSWRLRNSIASISAFTKIMLIELEKGIEESDIKERRKAFLDLGRIANREIGEVTSFLKKLLLISQSGGDFNPQRLDSKMLVDGWIRTVRSEFDKKSINFIMSPDSEYPKIMGDDKLLMKSGNTLLKVMLKVIDPHTEISVKSSTTALKGQRGLVVRFRLAKGAVWADSDWKSLFDPFSKSSDYDNTLELLGAFFVTYQHGGEITVNRDFEDGCGLDFFLPLNNTEEVFAPFENDNFDRLWEQFTGSEKEKASEQS
ncbi:MAG: response regulator [Verrucomicrobiota bacterium]